MLCPECKKTMKEDTNFLSVTSEPNWRERKGINFKCNNHVYTTELIFECKNEFQKMLLRQNNIFINWLGKLFFYYQYTENGMLERTFKR